MGDSIPVVVSVLGSWLATLGSQPLLPQPRVQGVAQPVAEKVESDHHDHDGQAWDGGQEGAYAERLREQIINGHSPARHCGFCLSQLTSPANGGGVRVGSTVDFDDIFAA